MGQDCGVERKVVRDVGLVEGIDRARAVGRHEAGACISLEAEVPEVLFDGMREFIRSHPQWDQYRLITSALASFLFQNGSQDASVSQHYLNGLAPR